MYSNHSPWEIEAWSGLTINGRWTLTISFRLWFSCWSSCREEVGSPGPRLGTPRLLFLLPESYQSKCGGHWESPGNTGWSSSVSMQEAWVDWVSLFWVLPFHPAQVTRCYIWVQIYRASVSTTVWNYRAVVSLSMVLGSLVWAHWVWRFCGVGWGGPQGIPHWCPRWRQTSEREAGGVGAEGMVHPWLTGGVGIPG